MIIATDIDGVLADFASGWVGHYNAEFGAGLDVGDLSAWDSIVSSTRFASADEFFTWLDGVEGFWRDLSPFGEAPEAVRHLRRDGHRMVAVSQRPEPTRLDTVTWLQRHFDGMPLVLTQDKSRVGADLLVDDSPDVLRSLVGTATVPVRFARPWNDGAPGVVIGSWDDLVQLLAAADGGHLTGVRVGAGR